MFLDHSYIFIFHFAHCYTGLIYDLAQALTQERLCF